MATVIRAMAGSRRDQCAMVERISPSVPLNFNAVTA
jgi:hypothetical protein